MFGAETRPSASELGGSNGGWAESGSYLGAQQVRFAERAAVGGKEEIQDARVGMTFPVTGDEREPAPLTPGVGWTPDEVRAGRKPGCDWQMDVLEAMGLEQISQERAD